MYMYSYFNSKIIDKYETIFYMSSQLPDFCILFSTVKLISWSTVCYTDLLANKKCGETA